MLNTISLVTGAACALEDWLTDRPQDLHGMAPRELAECIECTAPVDPRAVRVLIHITRLIDRHRNAVGGAR